MSDVRNKANSLNASFPVPGVNNSTQGFRDNTAATQAALFQASDELDRLQITRLRFTGDATGESERLGNAPISGTVDPTLTFPFTLLDAHSGETQLDTRTRDFKITMDSKGRVTTATLVDQTINFASGHAAAQLLAPVEGSAGEFTFPTLSFNTMGRLIQTGKQTLQLGIKDLKGQPMSRGSLLIGSSTNLSSEFSPPSGSGTFALVATGSTLAWQAVNSGTVTGVLGGQGISVVGDAATPRVDLDLTKITIEPEISNVDHLIFLDNSDNLPKRVTLNELKATLGEGGSALNPELAGHMDVKIYRIMSSEPQGVVLWSKNESPKSTLSLTESGIALQGSTGTTLTLQAPSVALSGASLALTSAALIVDGNGFKVLENALEVNKTNVVIQATGLNFTAPDINLSGSIEVTGGTTHNGTLVLLGDLNQTGNQTVEGSLSLLGNQSIQGDQNITGDQTVGGDSILLGNQDIAGNQSVAGTQTVSGSQLVTLNQNVLGNQNVTGNQRVTGDQIVTGASTADGGLTVTGDLRQSTGLLDINATQVNVQGTTMLFSGTDLTLLSDSIDVRTPVLEVDAQAVKLVTNGLVFEGGSVEARAATIGVVATDVEVESDEIQLTGTNTRLDAQTLEVTTTLFDLDATQIDVVGDAVTLTGDRLEINGSAWPVVGATTGQYLTAGDNGQMTWSTPQAVSFTPLPNTFFVGEHGSDTQGNGSLVTPFRTIGKALSLVPKANAAHYNLVVMGGSYDESLTLDNYLDLSIEGMFQTTKARINGRVNLNYNLGKIRFANLEFLDTTTDSQPTVMMISGVDSLEFEDVNILRNSDDLPAMVMSGEITQNVRFNGGQIRGEVVDVTFNDGEQFSLVVQSLDSKKDLNQRIKTVEDGYILGPRDLGYYLRVIQTDTDGAVVNIPNSQDVKMPLGATIRLRQVGIGQVSIGLGDAVKLNTPYGVRLRGRDSTVELIQVETDVWDLSGDLDTSDSLITRVYANDSSIFANSLTVGANS